jgi:GAF domain-containing protein
MSETDSDKDGAAMTDHSTEREARLGEAFVILADTLVGDFDVVELLGELSRTCVDVLDAGAAGLMLADQRGHLRFMAASSEKSRLLELLELQYEQGPCLDCYHTGAPVSADDLVAETTRWPSFALAAREAGFSSVHALPLRLRDQTIGAMNLFHNGSRRFDDADLRTAQALADVATIGILQHRAAHHSALLAEQLQTALNSRLVIEQAKGVLAERGQLDMDAAFELLRRYARDNRTGLSNTARQIVQRELHPETVLGHA